MRVKQHSFFIIAHVGINNPPVPKPDTQETENLDKAISLD
jgi:hypothetical protein